jgi:anti-sigma-K factor RskA
MTCRYAHLDGAYVLGALAPAERAEFERHLPGCEACTRAVAELAGLPGLLGRVDPAVLEEPVADEPPPSTLLPALLGEVRRTRRRRALAAAAAAAAAAAVVVAVPVALVQLGDDSPARVQTEQSPTPEPPEARPMQPVGDVPVRATVSLEQVTWGTRLGLTCSYDPESVEYELPPAADYTLVVRSRSGQVEQVGSWRSVRGREMSITAATALTPADLASVEVRTADGRVVLRLAT